MKKSVQWEGDPAVLNAFPADALYNMRLTDDGLYLYVAGNKTRCNIGDYIVCEADGAYHVCGPDIFNEKHGAKK